MQFSATVAKTVSIWTEIKKQCLPDSWSRYQLYRKTQDELNIAVECVECSELLFSLEMSMQV